MRATALRITEHEPTHDNAPDDAADDRRNILRQVLALSHLHVESMLSNALACYGEGDLTKAADILRGLVWLAPEDPRPLNLLGSTYLLLHRRSEAEDAYARALVLEPNDLYTLVALAELKLEDMRVDEAVPLFERLFELDPVGHHPAAQRGATLVRAYYTKMRG